ncbi:MAG: hypothetical protein QF890_11240 [Myxococcota bacterium]|nr:hypothetical protein [Myxococcota bacterium]MDP6244281.1 hypothetical protein [Myxococcota bacterium]MDP7073809.1 hypothetical protein [Myxococcota bacterium]MDP7300322.1 hypothetical protein [Myxococcota bacterium]MDP7433134.1 hypothetical protein [Myxococcota bacterium]
MSGYSEDPTSPLLTDQKHTSFLQKPFAPDELLEQMRALLKS